MMKSTCMNNCEHYFCNIPNDGLELNKINIFVTGCEVFLSSVRTPFCSIVSFESPRVLIVYLC